LVCRQTVSGSLFRGQPTDPSWWKPAPIWLIRFGFRSRPTRSPTVRSISAIRLGRITLAAITASARLDSGGEESDKVSNTDSPVPRISTSLPRSQPSSGTNSLTNPPASVVPLRRDQFVVLISTAVDLVSDRQEVIRPLALAPSGFHRSRSLGFLPRRGGPSPTRQTTAPSDRRIPSWCQRLAPPSTHCPVARQSLRPSEGHPFLKQEPREVVVPGMRHGTSRHP